LLLLLQLGPSWSFSRLRLKTKYFGSTVVYGVKSFLPVFAWYSALLWYLSFLIPYLVIIWCLNKIWLCSSISFCPLSVEIFYVKSEIIKLFLFLHSAHSSVNSNQQCLRSRHQLVLNIHICCKGTITAVWNWCLQTEQIHSERK